MSCAGSSYDSESRKVCMEKFARWLNRESSQCRGIPMSLGSKDTVSQFKQSYLDKCKNAWPTFARTSRRTRKATKQTCDEKRLAETKRFIETFYPETRGYQGFCAAASEYLKRPDWGYDDCVTPFQKKGVGRGGARPVSQSEIIDYFTKTNKDALCPYIDDVVANAKELSDLLQDVEQKQQPRSDLPRVRFLNALGEISPIESKKKPAGTTAPSSLAEDPELAAAIAASLEPQTPVETKSKTPSTASGMSSQPTMKAQAIKILLNSLQQGEIDRDTYLAAVLALG